MKDIDPNLNFIEIGLDSLLLTQVAITLKREFSLPVSFRQLNENLNTLNLLSDYLDAGLPPESFQSNPIAENSPEGEINQQIAALNKKLDLIRYAKLNPGDINADEEKEIKKPFGASPRIEKQSQELDSVQSRFLKDLIVRYNLKTKASKEYTQKHRDYMADPRVVSGFRPLTKEIIYPIVIKKSKGSRLWDLDNNEYIDALNGFGSNMLGFQPDSILNAIKDQMDKGYEIGPQHELAGDVCKLICEFTNSDRAALCSTGSEAVLGTMRIARAVTGRSLIVAFSGSYHGVFDEVIVRGTKTFRSIPAAAGIMPEAVQNMLILEYGTDESLKIIQERAHELAAVLVEPVQSRRPDFHPIDFLKKVREITEKTETVLIFDEVITGFRMHPGGAQALFGIKPDVSSYGKVIGGGLPIGAIAGKKQFMDALDGGSWQYGDQSVPEAGVTYFAGTFVRHPLALAAAKASLEYFKLKGPSLQKELSQKTSNLMSQLNSVCQQLKVPVSIVGFGSMWKIKFDEEIPYSELLFTLMREKSIHIWDGFPCFITESHTGTELNAIALAFEESLNQMISAGFISSKNNISKDINLKILENEPPVPGAKLGRDQEGNPAWFIADPENTGKYLQVKHNN
jgi:glutamate-1-semialdehyde aminotransferase/acyl carrier protein